MRTALMIALFICCSSCVHSEDHEGTGKKDRLIDINGLSPGKGSFHYTLFGRSVYGITDDIAISAHPVLMFLSPSVDVNCKLMSQDRFSLSGVSGISYPTQLMRLVTTKGTGGFISPEFEIPHLFALRTGIIATISVTGEHFLSGTVLFEFALNNSSLEPGTSIDLPLIAPRNAVYYKNAGFDVAAAAEGEISSVFDYRMKLEFFLFPFPSKRYDSEYPLGQQDLFWEMTGNILWKVTGTAYVSPGFMLTYGDYPFGGQWHLFPVIDFIKWIE